MQGEFEPSAFFDIWDRGLKGGGGDTNAGACWQSVLTDVTWSDVSASSFLTALKAAAAAEVASGPDYGVIAKGGKAAAAARRIVVQEQANENGGDPI